jgi:chromosome segregation ATPase
MQLKLNENGQLIDETGNPFQVNGEAVTVEGARTQGDVDRAIEARLARERQTNDSLRDAAKRVPELQQALEDSNRRLREYEHAAAEAQETARKEVQSQLSRYRSEAEQYRTALEQERQGRLQTEVRSQILSAAGNRFVAPDVDVVPHLMQAHRREPVPGQEGQYVDLFEVPVRNDDGTEARKAMPLGEALQTWATRNPHHVRPEGTSGTGGSGYRPAGGVGAGRRGEMSQQQKLAFIAEHGFEGYQRLPE